MKNDHHAVMLRVADVNEASAPEIDDAEVLDFTHDQLGISEARSLTAKAYKRPAEASVQLLLVRTAFITHEAQNALLKLLEGPPSTTRFVFFVPYDLQILPTLTSRLAVEIVDDASTNETFAEFIKSSTAERIGQIEVATKNKDNEWMREIKRGLITKMVNSNSLEEKEVLELVSRLLLTRGASNKMLLEHAALTLPRS